MAAQPQATTTETQLIMLLDTVSQVLFLLPVCGQRAGAGRGGAGRGG